MAWYEEAVALADEVGTVPRKPRSASIQRNRNNTQADTPNEHYRRTQSIQFLDHLINEVSDRFSDRNMAVLDGFYGLPSYAVCEGEWKQHFERYMGLYSDDLSESRLMHTEIDMWEATWNTNRISCWLFQIKLQNLLLTTRTHIP